MSEEAQEGSKKPGRPPAEPKAVQDIARGMRSKDGKWEVEGKKDDENWIIIPIGDNKAFGRFPVATEQLRALFGV